MALTFTDATGALKQVGVAATKYYIGTTATDPATDTYVEIAGVISFPEFGKTADEVSQPTIGNPLNTKSKGLVQLGGGDLMCTKSEGDDGQDALIAASDDFSGSNYNIAVVQPDKILTRGTTYFIKALVRGDAFGAVGGPNEVAKLKVGLIFNSKPVKVAAT